LIEQLTPRMIIMNTGKIVADDRSEVLLKNEKLLFDNGLI
jgi:hypothetical protein